MKSTDYFRWAKAAHAEMVKLMLEHFSEEAGPQCAPIDPGENTP